MRFFQLSAFRFVAILLLVTSCKKENNTSSSILTSLSGKEWHSSTLFINNIEQSGYCNMNNSIEIYNNNVLYYNYGTLPSGCTRSRFEEGKVKGSYTIDESNATISFKHPVFNPQTYTIVSYSNNTLTLRKVDTVNTSLYIIDETYSTTP